jgi:HlyD family secretion protein
MMKKQKVLVFMILLAVFVVFSWVAYSFYKNNTQHARVLQGEIDAQTYAISSKLAGRIAHMYVKKGDDVEVGDVVFSLYSPEAEAKLAQALAAQEVAKAQKQQAYHATRKQQLNAAIAQYNKAKVAADLMEKTYMRVEELYKEGVVSQQKRDEVFTKYQAARYTQQGAKEMMEMAQEGARKEVKKAAAAQEKVYAAKVQEVDAYIKEQKALSFHRGEVSQILIHEGELAPSGFAVVSIVDMEDVWARFAVREDDLHLFVKGKKVFVKIPALGEKKYSFEVSYISVMGEFATYKASENAQGYDMKSFEVHLRAVEKIEGLRVGMSVLVEL